MNIQEFGEKCKSVLTSREFYTLALIILVGFGSFGLGRLSAVRDRKMPIKIEYEAEKIPAAVVSAAGEKTVPAVEVKPAPGGQYVASKSGTKYHLPWCGGAQSIKESNKIWFDSKEAAEKAGYEPAENCKGI